jgi:hypothetical protein
MTRLIGKEGYKALQFLVNCSTTDECFVLFLFIAAANLSFLEVQVQWQWELSGPPREL